MWQIFLRFCNGPLSFSAVIYSSAYCGVFLVRKREPHAPLPKGQITVAWGHELINAALL